MEYPGINKVDFQPQNTEVLKAVVLGFLGYSAGQVFKFSEGTSMLIGVAAGAFVMYSPYDALNSVYVALSGQSLEHDNAAVRMKRDDAINRVIH